MTLPAYWLIRIESLVRYILIHIYIYFRFILIFWKITAKKIKSTNRVGPGQQFRHKPPRPVQAAVQFPVKEVVCHGVHLDEPPSGGHRPWQPEGRRPFLGRRNVFEKFWRKKKLKKEFEKKKNWKKIIFEKKKNEEVHLNEPSSGWHRPWQSEGRRTVLGRRNIFEQFWRKKKLKKNSGGSPR